MAGPVPRHAGRDVGAVDAEMAERSAETFLDGQCGFRRHAFSLLRRYGETANCGSVRRTVRSAAGASNASSGPLKREVRRQVCHTTTLKTFVRCARLEPLSGIRALRSQSPVILGALGRDAPGPQSTNVSPEYEMSLARRRTNPLRGGSAHVSGQTVSIPASPRIGRCR